MDEALRALAEEDRGARGSVALVAVGGYGRGELWPGSDVDVLMLHADGADAAAERLSGAVLYPLWDLGLRTGHATRTVAESLAEGARDVRSLTAMMDARLVAGSAELFAGLVAGVDACFGSASERDAIVGLLAGSRERRRERFGVLGRSQEPDLKEALGGLRDIAMLGWLARVGRVAAGAGVPAGSAERLAAARAALHLVAAPRGNRLAAADQEAVAEALGTRAKDGWEPRDVLLRSVLLAGRAVDALVEAAFERALPAEAAAGGPAAATSLAQALADARDPRGSLDSLLRALAAGDTGILALRIADEQGALARVLPEWDLVRARAQRDPYHQYPVDVHLLETAAEAGRILSAPADEFERAAVARLLGDRSPVLLGALLHDVGKIGRGSHLVAGEELARKVLDRLSPPVRLREDVLFVVREHLLLADTATRRNMDDEDVVLRVAAAVGDARRLALLSIVTLADAAATGPGAASPWRLGLIRDLVLRVERAIERGLAPEGEAERLARAGAALRAALADRPATDVEAFIASVPSGYLHWVEPADAPAHLALLVPRPAADEIRVDVRPGRAEGVHRVAVASRDRPGLLAALAGAFSVAGLSILAAQVFTTPEGVVLDVFDVRPAFREEADEGRWDRLRTAMAAAAAGDPGVAARVRDIARHARAGPKVPVTVRVDRDASDFYAVVEVGAADRPGLLFDLAGAFADAQADVHLAKVATYGPRVVDVFYVTDLAGHKPADTAELEAALRRAAKG